MAQAKRVLSTPPTDTSVTCRSVTGITLTSDSPSPFEAVDLALLRFVNCLARYGLTIEEADAVVLGEIERLRPGRPRPRPVVRSASEGHVARLQRRLDNWQRLRHPAAV
jgi:hypothetical protein